MNDSTRSISTPQGIPTPQAEAPARPIGKRAAVLMVDDQPARLLTYESILHGLGIECVRALSGLEALDRLLKQEFAAIITDVEMPGLDGFELARLIREHPRLEKTPIVFITGVHVTELDQLKGYEVGAIDYISVPVVPVVLRTKIAVLVELYQRRRQLQDLNSALKESRARTGFDPATRTQERLGAAFENPSQLSAILAAVRDASGHIVDWLYEDANTAVAAALGYARERLIGQTLSTVLGARAPAQIAICTQAATSQRPVQYEQYIGERHLLSTAYAAGEDCVVVSATDISRQKQAEDALRVSERRYRTLVDNAPVGVAHCALSGEFLYINRCFCELVGYTLAELLTKRWQEITHPEDVGEDQALANDVVAQKIPDYTIEKRFIRKDGSVVYVELFGSFVVDDEGRAIQGIAIAIDTTARRQSNLALRESQERLLLAKAAAKLGTFDWSIPCDRLVWDERTHEIWGIEPAGPTKVAAFFSQVHADDHAPIQVAIDKSFDPHGDGMFGALYRVINRVDGITRWVEATGRVYFDGEKPTRMIGVVQEVTERILSQRNLAESEERFRDLANNIDQFAWTCDELGKGTWYNDRWYDYTGTTAEEMCGDGWHRVHHPAHLARVVAHLQRCLSSGTPWEDTFPLRGKNGSYRWFLSRAVPIRDSTGKVVRWFGTNTDVTELRKLQDALQETDRRKDEFLAMLAHELRNPVAPIRNAAEVLNGVLKNDNERALVEIIRRQTTQLAHLLDDLLDIARITAGHIDLRRETLPLQSCIDAAIETVEPLIRQKRQRLTVTHTFTSLFVHADKVRMTQCISNLLINAAKFTAPGGEIRILPRADGTDAVVEVSDTGIGIAREFLPHVFDLFAQAERSSDRSQGGLGIGLSVCKRLLEMHDGSISVRSAGLGHGTTFTVRIPVVPAPALAPSIAIDEQQARVRVIIVDDNRDGADSLALLFEASGHEAHAVYSAQEALQVVLASPPDVVVLDIGLPQMDGHEVARRLRAGGCQSRLIALSGYGQQRDIARSKQVGFDDHLVKPVDTNTLMKAVLG